MRLGLSSAAAPDAALADLVAACAARGLTTLELRAGDGHGMDAAGSGWDAVERALESAANGVTIAGYRTDGNEDNADLARLSQRLGAPILVSCACGITERIERARGIMDEGGRAIVLAEGDAAVWHPAIVAAGLDYGWEVDTGCANVAEHVELVIQRQEPVLRYIRFIGGGPEAALQEGRGIGTLMGRLALAGYDGALVLVPSSTRYRVAWETWLGRRGGWGCGSKSSAAELVHLPVRTATGGK